ncbi:hypothetical protein [Rhizobium sp. BK176]|uniref:hypothetical protein n=1 Tax=Rhizobium sp. BK176 TaxID=2587071 RepID=UPI00216708DF|nr:hypothetical protein [Rhizobium sp. BK176]MCS4089059.1 hypothetical protein [Rhizobium sp. BK176]
MRQLLSNGVLEMDQDLLTCRSFAVGGLVFDNENGVGAVPNLAEIFWKGALVGMTPRMFHKLTPPLSEDERPKTNAFLRTNQDPLGTPYLMVKLDTKTNALSVNGHEGRHRMSWMARNFGPDFEIPVGLFVLEDHYNLKARETETSIIERIAEGVRREKSREFVHGPLFERAVWSHGELGIEARSAKAAGPSGPGNG